MAINLDTNPDALPQLIGEFKPVDEWQAHISRVFYGLRGARVHEYYQTFASADYRLAHALASDYYQRVIAREQAQRTRHEARDKSQGSLVSGPESRGSRLTIHEWGCGNGNLAACFLTHLKTLDKDGSVYPRVRYVLVDAHQSMLDSAAKHPDLISHKERVETLCADVSSMVSVADGTVDRILCNELWNELPAKLMLRKGNEFEEEHLRPNLSEKRHAEIADWPAFVRAFDGKDVAALQAFPAFLEDIIWEKEYHKTEWKDVPYRKTITDFLKQIDDHVLVPVNLGAFGTVKEAKRVLASNAVGFSSFDAGADDLAVLNDPEKPCYGLFGGLHSFMVNVALVKSVAGYLGITSASVEAQREFVGRSLNTNVISLMDLLACYPSPRSLQPWEQDRLIIRTIHAFKDSYRSPYRRKIDFPVRKETPAAEREALRGLVSDLGTAGVADTVAYLTEQEIAGAMAKLEVLGYERELIMAALAMPVQPIDYRHFSFDSK
jgi:hypothetical protein